MVVDHYIETVLEKASESWPEDGTVDEKWQAVSTALTSMAEDVHIRNFITSPTRLVY